MAWGPLGTQFCLELAFGVLLGLCLIPKAPLGLFFFRLMGTTAVVPLLAAGLLPPLYSGGAWSDPTTVAALVAIASFPLLVGPVRTGTRFLGLIWATVACGAALVFIVASSTAVEGPAAIALGAASAMATGTVAGGVGLAMVVGHWYLTVPQLPISTLARLNRFTIVAMLVSCVLVGLSCGLYAEQFELADKPLFSSFGLFYLTARVAVGLAVPLLFAWMTAGSLAHQNTRSATGILYASTVLVLIGTAVSLSLQDKYGVPL
ncbi:MAG: hypothetical protein ACI8QC_000849 [Planctomycetota bacterium]|jgi:hypothetical protein